MTGWQPVVTRHPEVCGCVLGERRVGSSWSG